MTALFPRGAALALLALGCVDVGAIPAAEVPLEALQWNKAPAPPAGPPGLSGHAMATLGNKVVLFGGYLSTGAPSRATWQWDGRTWTELAPPASPSARAGHAMAALGNKVILFGGVSTDPVGVSGDPTADPSRETWVWDGTTWTLLAPPSSPPARSGHAMATVGNKVVLFGGDPGNGLPTNDTWEWDGTTWTQRTPIDAPAARSGHAMATLGDKVVLFGGENPNGPPDTDIWEWGGSAWARKTPGLPPEGRSGHAMATIGNKVIMYGGDTSSWDSSTWQWDGTTWTVIQVPGPELRSRHAMASLNGMIVMFGGEAPTLGGGAGSGAGGVGGAAGHAGGAGPPPPPIGAGGKGGVAGAPPSPTGAGGAGGKAGAGAAPPPLGAGGAAGTFLPGAGGDPGGAGGGPTPPGDGGASDGGLGAPATSPGAGGSSDEAGGATANPSLELAGGGGEFGDTWEWNGQVWLPRSVSSPTSSGYSGDGAMAVLGGKALLVGNNSDVGAWEWDGVMWTAVAPPVRPAPRMGHAMAAVGDKIVLFGGSDSDGLEEDTWEWDGTKWTARPSPTSPRGRTGHAMAALGGKLVLFGGSDNLFSTDNLHNDTWEWDGATWTERTPPVSPPGRMGHAMVTMGDKIVLFGGEDADGVLNDTWEWNGSTWTAVVTPSPPARSRFAMATWNKSVLLFGGSGTALFGGSGADAALHDTWALTGGAWTQLTPMTYPPAMEPNFAASIVMATLADTVVLVGTSDGETWLLGPPRAMIKLRFSTDVWIALLALGLGCIDVSSIPAPSSEALDWKNPPELSRPRQGVAFDAAAMATLGDQTILFKGESATTWSWDGRTWTQLHPATSPSARSGARMATLRNKVVLFGGSGANAPGDDTWEWNGTTWKQLAPPSRPPARSDHAMATLDDKVVVFGGSGSAGLLDDTWEWDGATWSQVTSGGGPSARTSAAMATLGHKVVLFGGKVPGGDYYNYYSYQFADTWEWDGSGWTERTPGLASDPPAGSNYAMATLGDKLVMSGANDPAGSHLWEWDGTSWTSVGPFCSAGCPGDGPSTGFGAMASRKETVLLVGRGLGSTNETWEWNGERLLPRLVASPTYQLGDSHPATGLVVADRRVAMAAMGDKVVLWGDAVGTWEWDGALWTALAPSTSPPKRSGHAMATLRDKVVLFGGWPAPGFPVGQPLADTWEWDGTTWTRRDPPASPPPRAGHAMATLGNKVVLFGGSDLDGHPLGDTWEWDGTTWTERTSADGPTARYAHAMASLGDRVVLFGGVGVSNETWAWDGATWTQLASTSAPTARSASAMATLKDSVILFGGFEGETPVHDTWALTGGEWTQVLPTTYPPERGDHAMATFAGEVVLVGGSDDRSTWLLGAFPGGGSSGAGTGGTDNVTTGAGGSGAAAGDGGGGGSAPMGKGGTGPGAAGGAAGSAATGRGGSGGGSQGIPLQQDGSGHYDGSNAAGVIGSWWSAGDDYGSDSTAGSGTCRMAGFPAATCSVLSAPTPGLPFQPDPSGRGMCASGTAARVMNDATGAPAYSSIWGDIIGFDLNNPGSLSDGVNLRSQYDAVAHGITGFAFDIDSVPAGGHLRIAFETLGTEANLAYWQGASMDLSPISSPGHYEFRWPQVGGPYYLPNAPPFDPTLLESVVFQVVSNTTTPVPFSFCISSVMLLTN